MSACSPVSSEFSGSYVFLCPGNTSASTVRGVFQYHFPWNNLLSIIFMAVLNFKRELRGIENLLHIPAPKKAFNKFRTFQFYIQVRPQSQNPAWHSLPFTQGHGANYPTVCSPEMTQVGSPFKHTRTEIPTMRGMARGQGPIVFHPNMDHIFASILNQTPGSARLLLHSAYPLKIPAHQIPC